MENQTKHAQPTSGRSSRWSMLIRLYQKWRTWRLKVQTRRSLLRMSDERLKDIGLTRDDIDRL
ncbi:DUF1127 domain-containing protein [Brenneria goodwinii]|uniref:DUF1127 domain-containing protein n=1 Tax=Brenneria goodwinii TaxID=1109412 RepID=UPI000907E9EC|nr:DUF1127 domain-containing protein [Brenneria goodwinii]MCG8158873.1 DUF1127 domain-containing protein [Brenneria goodwinii]MCG8163574.1 DUF1127 domain-containing protein [Brenneria goodwinii]MCG8168129.1 DUF1127 domain-containing protein [Brenneria goodwinii]MCG8172783.1 DUF1127 domain-containing protein [Brenneria goodwinii]MCG8177479.1 DUF1127 domain-containing protein [Brenneria goodwinii]